MTYYDPPIDYGMEISLGNTVHSSGNIKKQNQESNKLDGVGKDQSSVKPTSKSNAKINPSKKSKSVLTERKSSISIPKKESSIKQNQDPNKLKENKKIEKLPIKKENPKVSKTTKNIVSNLLKKNSQLNEELSDNSLKGLDENIQNESGYSSTYYNNMIFGSYTKGYGLNGRSLKFKGKVLQECNEQGLVVVRISVNRQGDVVSAEPGVKGTTNTHPCLLDPAKKTAQLHKWFPDDDAPELQIGFVVIQFKLGE
nr:energy transducer TonB [uncultured bacterium]